MSMHQFARRKQNTLDDKLPPTPPQESTSQRRENRERQAWILSRQKPEMTTKLALHQENTEGHSASTGITLRTEGAFWLEVMV